MDIAYKGGNVPLRMAITKVSGQGEQLVIDVSQWNGVTGEMCHSVDEMAHLFNEALEIADLRLQEMNMRMLEAYNVQDYFDVSTWQKITQLLDIIAGRVSAAQVVQRWQATIEENAALEEARRVAYANGAHNGYADNYVSDEV